MDRALWQRHLKLANEHIAMGARNVEKQRQVVATLRRDRHPTEMAERILAAYESLMVLHREDRDRLEKELAADAARRPRARLR